MAKLLSKFFLQFFIFFVTFPASIYGLPSLHGKYPGSLFIVASCFFALLYKVMWLGKKYLISIFIFTFIAIFTLLLLEEFTKQNVLELVFRSFILLTPFLFANVYLTSKSNKVILFQDLCIITPIIIIFLPFFITNFGIDPFIINESQMTSFFNNNILNSALMTDITLIYYVLGNTTTISPALTFLFFYVLMKGSFYFKKKANILAFIYIFMSLIIFYTSLWFQQRILLGVLVIYLFLDFNFYCW